MTFENIVSRLDGSYIIDLNGYPYHVPNEGEFAELWGQVNAYALGHPEEVTPEAPPPEPSPPSLEEARALRLAEVMRKYEAAFIPIELVYPKAEREGWAIQEAEARAALADPQAETPVLSVLAQMRARGETVAELAATVLANAAKWRAVYACLTGQQQRMYGEINGLMAVEDILAYPVAYEMPEGV